MFLTSGLLLTFCAMSFDYRIFNKHAKVMVLIAIVLLGFLFVPGISREISGAKRWFRLAGFNFQPSEFANLSVIVYTAAFLSNKGHKRKDSFLAGFLPPMLILGSVSILILAQPDLGTVIAIGTVVFIMLFASGTKVKYILGIVLAALPALYVLIFRVPYRRARITSFLNPWADPLGSGFQLIQSQVAIGSGGFFGRGMGKSLQKLYYLPAGHTDFIYSIIGEELGFFATIGILVLFTLLIVNGLKIVKHAQDSFGSFLALGITSLIALKAFINIGVSCGIFPTKGLPLPFISYGGSALVFDMVGIGLLLNVARFAEDP